MTVQELAAWRLAGTPHMLLDVREPHELAICAVEGATAIPMAQVPARLAELPQDAPVVVMCHHGARSQMVVNFLLGQLGNAGRDRIFNLEGGIDAWARQIDGSVALY
jgi:rhodanese-related sulfurtransferase